LRRAITGDELLEGVYVSLDKFFAEKWKSFLHLK
jgi:hypothetical protein